ncbi:glutamate-gated chloride channel [Trichonephila clavata]|uniref:Glutamate-gated chloride channel n=1 Tax=Trichonephila clavata TaxID=2740835 RepID=A0A8X6G8Y6_TRICU|nr:glutamate-gated chloride channel [Trichonephila clavata]
MIFLVKFATIATFLSIGYVQSRKSFEEERQILNKIFDGYDSTIRPAGENGTGPVIVEVNTYIRSLSNMDDVKMSYEELRMLLKNGILQSSSRIFCC